MIAFLVSMLFSQATAIPATDHAKTLISISPNVKEGGTIADMVIQAEI